MKSLYKSVAVGRISLLQLFLSPRVPCLAILATIILYYMTNGITEFSLECGYAMTPWLLPSLLLGREGRLMLYGISLLLTCDLADKDRSYVYQIERTGTVVYSFGKLLHLTAVTFLYTLFLAIAPIVIRFRYIRFSADWGKVLGSYTKAWLFLENGLVSSKKITDYLTVPQAMIASFVLLWGSFLMLGLIVFFVREISGSMNMAIISGGLLLILDQVFHTINSVEFNLTRWIFPLCWSNMDTMNIGRFSHGPTLEYAITATALLNVILMILVCVLTISRRGGDIDG